MVESPVIIIQARMGSTRLPGKILKNFWNGKTILDLILEQANSVVGVERTVLAIPNARSDDILFEKYDGEVKITRGNELDVLARFLQAIQETGAHSCIRICADNPFIIPEEIKRLIDFGKKTRADYAGFKIGSLPSIKTHCGFFTEYATADALQKESEQCRDLSIREHVTNYLYTSPTFLSRWITEYESDPLIGKVRLTIDDEHDFTLAREIYHQAREKKIPMDVASLTKFITEVPAWLEHMSENIARNQK